MLKPSFEKNNSDTFEPIVGGIREIYIFPKGICLKVNIIMQLEFELSYYDVAVQPVDYNVTWTLPV